MKRLPVLLLLLAPIVAAGEVHISWGPSTAATGYRVFHGTATGVYGSPPIDVGMVQEHTLVLPDDQASFVAVKAYNAAGESGFTPEITGWPRATLAGSIGEDCVQGSVPLACVLSITGSNFAPGTQVTFDNPNVVVGAVTVFSATSLTVAVTIATPAQGATVNLGVQHGWLNADGTPAGTVATSTMVTTPIVLPSIPPGLGAD